MLAQLRTPFFMQKIMYNGYNEICLVDTYALNVRLIST